MYALKINNVNKYIELCSSCFFFLLRHTRHLNLIFLTFFFCRYNSTIKGNNALPPEDRLLKFLVDNNADIDETVLCANCDQESSKNVQHLYTIDRL